MRAPLPHQLPYRADVDGLRALAVLAVIIFHARPGSLPGGFVGVDVFFVISGFLISSLLLDSAQKGTFSLADFYARRFRRILPALILVLCAVAIAGWFFLLPHEFADLGRMIVSSVVFVPNIQLWTEEGYFAGHPNMRPLLHLWSLGVEEQFYLFWPWLVLLFWKKRLPWIIGLLAGASFLASILLLQRYPSAVFYFPMTRLWELLTGAFLAWHERQHLHSALGAAVGLPAWIREILSVLGLMLILGGALLMNSTLPFPGWRALPPVIGAAAFIAAGSRAWLNRHVLAHPVAIWLGLISYPLYLWHWPLLIFLRLWKGDEPTNHAKYIAVLVAILLAWMTYRFIERPIRSKQLLGGRRSTIPILLAGLGIVAIVGAAIIATKGLPTRYPATVRPFLTYRYDVTDSWNYKCFLQYSQLPNDWTRSACIQPQTNPPEPLVVLWGDSHAGDLRPGLDALQRTKKFRIGQMTATGCPPFVNVDVQDRPFCRSENDIFIREIREVKPDVVIISAYWYKVGFRSLGQTIKMLKEANIKHVIVMGPSLEWEDSLSDLLIRYALRNNAPIPATLGPEMRVAVPEAALKSFAKKEGASYISIVDALCSAGRCVAMTRYGPQYVTFLDQSHFRDPGSQLLMQRIADRIFSGVNVESRSGGK